MSKRKVFLTDDPFWYKDAIIYELHVKSFFDSNGDGIGDFKGLIQKLDYLQSLGINAIWLLPFYPSPLKDDGYDIADYFRVNTQYGSLHDFKLFLTEAHQRGIRVITELVLNHTSDQHEWFQKSRRSNPESIWKDFYVWNDTAEKYKDARIIFTDFETSNWEWDPAAKQYFWHRFYSHQPDLNYDNPNVIKAVLKVVDYWLEMGVDGLRLDAVPYLFEREGTNCENLPETYQYMEKLRSHIDKKFKGKMLLAEANQWPEDAVAYFGDGNRCHMAFHFPIMPRLFMGSWMEDRFPIIDIFEQTPKIPDNCQWVMFLRNHDELTLEMVSDEERDYMYRIYAKDPTARINLGIRRRLAPLLANNRRKIELMNFLLFSLPGTPVIYYGDEIGMGDNHYLGDRNGVRTPMQWNADRNAGFSRENPQKLFLPVIIDPDYHYESVNVENQERNQSSLLWWMKRVIATRKRFKAFGRGSIEFLNSDNPKVLAFVRNYEDENILVVVNLSRFSQAVQLDLSKYIGCVPEEAVSGNKFPPITGESYILTLGFYNYYWFILKKEEQLILTTKVDKIPELVLSGDWKSVFIGKAKDQLVDDILPGYLKKCRWFAGKSRVIRQIKLNEIIPIGKGSSFSYIVFIELRYSEGTNEIYILPLSFVSGEQSEKIKEYPQAIIAYLKGGTTEGLLIDASFNEDFRKNLLLMITKKQSVKGIQGQLFAYPANMLKRKKISSLPLDSSQVLRAEQSNTSMLYGNEYFLKLYRRIDEGIIPELEVGQFLTDKVSFPNVPAFAGAVEFRKPGGEPIVIGMLQKFVPNEGDAWTFSLNAASSYFERVLSKINEVKDIPKGPQNLLDTINYQIPSLMQELVGGVYLEMASLLGKRTAELHLALSSRDDDPKFSNEPFTLLYQRSVFHSMRTLTRRVFESIQKAAKQLEPEIKSEVEILLKKENDILSRFAKIYQKKISAVKIRIHGDYHLGQILYTGNDFVIIDFEGEPARSISERKLKRSVLRDVSGMVRSFHYAAYTALLSDKTLSPENIQKLKIWADLWYQITSGVFFKKYIEIVNEAPFIPKERDELKMMLDAYMLEKAIYEIAYELNNRPQWVSIPIHGITQLLEN